MKILLCVLLKIVSKAFILSINSVGGPGSSVGIATDYGLEGPGIESRWGRDFPPVQTGPGAHQPHAKWVTGLARG